MSDEWGEWLPTCELRFLIRTRSYRSLQQKFVRTKRLQDGGDIEEIAWRNIPTLDVSAALEAK